ncbi:hypothetical protein [Phaeospirillum tilakii]|uniref:Uncharacterized protein n=1 Tax=Phaeospirillum tilakii TaxID=741673 RepID=A0ABW5C4X6_9PROT
MLEAEPSSRGGTGVMAANDRNRPVGPPAPSHPAAGPVRPAAPPVAQRKAMPGIRPPVAMSPAPVRHAPPPVAPIRSGPVAGVVLMSKKAKKFKNDPSEFIPSSAHPIHVHEYPNYVNGLSIGHLKDTRPHFAKQIEVNGLLAAYAALGHLQNQCEGANSFAEMEAKLIEWVVFFGGGARTLAEVELENEMDKSAKGFASWEDFHKFMDKKEKK